jgi:hypothetical protein
VGSGRVFVHEKQDIFTTNGMLCRHNAIKIGLLRWGTSLISLHSLHFHSMKNFFEFFGFLTTAAMSAFLVFTFIGKKENRGGIERDRLVSAYSTSAIEGKEAFSTTSPRRITGKATKKSESEYEFTPAGAYGQKKNAKSAPAIETEPEMAPEEKLKALYDDGAYVRSAVKKWKSAARDIAEEYNVRPQVLLAHAIAHAYVGPYTRHQLEQDAARHGGERVMSVSAAIKKYPYGWTMQRLISGYDLASEFSEEVPVATASAYTAPKSKVSMAPAKTTAKSGAMATSKTNQAAPAEAGFQAMVAKEYGFSTWQGLMRLGDHQTKSEAQRRVKGLMTAARIR